jgi:Phospholipase_D-nuclease N-terminal
LIVRLVIAATVILFLVFWVRAVIDVFRRHDLTRASQAAWIIGMLVVPFIGLLIYEMLRPSDRQLRRG